MTDEMGGSQVTESQVNTTSTGSDGSGSQADQTYTQSQGADQASTQGQQGGASFQTQTPQGQSYSQIGWEMPLEWQDSEGRSIQAKVGELIEGHMASLKNKPILQLGQLVHAAVSGDQRARVALASLFKEAQARQSGQNKDTNQKEDSNVPAIPQEYLKRQESLEKMLYEKTVSEINSGLQNYIQQSKFNALKAEPKITWLIQKELMKAVQAGVRPTKTDVDNLLEKWNKYYMDLAAKINGGNGGSPTVIPTLGVGSAASAQGASKNVRWGNNPDQPDPKFRQYLKDKISNLLAENTP